MSQAQTKTMAEAAAAIMSLLPQRGRELSRLKVEGILYRAYQAAWNNGFDEAMGLMAPGKGQDKEPEHG